VGGIKIGALSNIDKRLTINLTVTKGKRAPHVVEPLPDAPAAPTEADVAKTDDRAKLRDWWNTHPALRPAIEARVAALDAEVTA
jgi:hypothetical protein